MRYATRLCSGLLVAFLTACGPDSVPPKLLQAEILRENPDLALYRQSDPRGFDAIVAEIERLQTLRSDPAITLPRKTRSITQRESAVVDLLRRNPIFADIYKRDPKTTRKLIGVILDQ